MDRSGKTKNETLDSQNVNFDNSFFPKISRWTFKQNSLINTNRVGLMVGWHSGWYFQQPDQARVTSTAVRIMVLDLSQFLASTPTASRNTTHYKIGQKWLENNNLALFSLNPWHTVVLAVSQSCCELIYLAYLLLAWLLACQQGCQPDCWLGSEMPFCQINVNPISCIVFLQWSWSSISDSTILNSNFPFSWDQSGQ